MKYTKILIIVGGILLLVGSLAHCFTYIWAPYVFAAGAVLMVVHSFLMDHDLRQKDNRTMRLGRIGFMSTLMLLLAAYCMFVHSTSWVVFLLIYVLISLFVSFRMPNE